MDNLNLVEIPIYIINFIITFVMLYLLLYKPVSKFLGARKERVEKSLTDAESTQKEAEKTLLQAQTELENTGEKARELSHKAIENAAVDAESIIDKAQEEADEMIARARAQMESERRAAMERAFTELVSLANDLAARILAREVSIEDNRTIVERFFSENTEGNDSTGESRVENNPENKILKEEGKKA